MGYEYTTNDLVTFESENESGLIRISGDKEVILLDITEESSFMLMEFFRYVNTELKENKND